MNRPSSEFDNVIRIKQTPEEIAQARAIMEGVCDTNADEVTDRLVLGERLRGVSVAITSLVREFGSVEGEDLYPTLSDTTKLMWGAEREFSAQSERVYSGAFLSVNLTGLFRLGRSHDVLVPLDSQLDELLAQDPDEWGGTTPLLTSATDLRTRQRIVARPLHPEMSGPEVSVMYFSVLQELSAELLKAAE